MLKHGQHCMCEFGLPVRMCAVRGGSTAQTRWGVAILADTDAVIEDGTSTNSISLNPAQIEPSKPGLDLVRLRRTNDRITPVCIRKHLLMFRQLRQFQIHVPLEL